MLFPQGAAAPVPCAQCDAAWAAASVPSGPPLASEAIESGVFSGIESLGDMDWNQVRIEQRMIIRIAPRLPGQLFAPLPSPPRAVSAPTRFYERKAAKCLPIASIAGVQAESASRLVLTTRSGRFIGASLDKTCSARDFYQGFYVERNDDGQLCAGRDIIHSRAGANCAITRMRELVPDDD